MKVIGVRSGRAFLLHRTDRNGAHLVEVEPVVVESDVVWLKLRV